MMKNIINKLILIFEKYKMQNHKKIKKTYYLEFDQNYGRIELEETVIKATSKKKTE